MNILRIQIARLSSKMSEPIKTKINECLSRELSPIKLEVVNESYMHGVPKNSETHFKVLVVSEKFTGLSLIQRHRIVNNYLKEELKTEFPHALSIVAKNPTEYDGEYKLEPSPNCRGGFGK
ncbi:unnamed protein product [Chironomus riparius]|uniref:BolA-like protein DDB_G0274169 n=1 Tax=Chironomus riparius TaxID=315576 RepID=A0A9N9WUS0_9DIPT|nr:unnamed protein product [Chironomus riparius]